MNNYSTLTSIISALGTAPIHRLNRTWPQISQKTMGTLEHMRKLMASTKNFGEYRETLHFANPPCIPFFGGSTVFLFSPLHLICISNRVCVCALLQEFI